MIGCSVHHVVQCVFTARVQTLGRAVQVKMKYVGRLASNGKVFDQTQGNKPFTFRLGVSIMPRSCLQT